LAKIGLVQKSSKTLLAVKWWGYIFRNWLGAFMDTTKADPSNGDANKGIVNILYEPYQPLIGR
jgi:hypothetical protein